MAPALLLSIYLLSLSSCFGQDVCSAADGRCGGKSKVLTVEKLPKRILDAQYAVRGEVLERALEIGELLSNGTEHSFPFKKLVPCHIGNPQSVGAKPLTFHRQMLSLLANPGLLDSPASAAYPADVVQRARDYLGSFPKFGAYSESRGVTYLRKQVADFMARRDGTEAPDVDNIYLTDGASSGISTILEMLISGPESGILIPIPQYPLYSGTIVRLGGKMVSYYLTEEDRWALSLKDLEASIKQARAEGVELKALVVINPGNPTGNVMERKTMEEVVRLCEREGLALLADEVYQENIWKDRPFISFRQVALSLGSSAEIFSFHSISKGFYGECGLRGGYMELLNIDPEWNSQLYKLRSMGLCANTLGQAMMASIVNPPEAGSASVALYEKERADILASLGRKAEMVYKVFNSVEGMSAQPLDGAMYVFPSIKLPKGFIEKAARNKRAADLQYCLELLEATGVVMVPGSGFGQVEGTFHFRMTILPEEEEFPAMLERIKTFHTHLVRSY